jgi:hypothetical protein
LNYTPGFEFAWKLYPSRGDNANPKALAFKQWRARLKQGVTEFTLTECTREYAEQMRRKGKTGTEYVMQAATFYGVNERYADFVPKPETERKTLTRAVEDKDPEEERIDARPFIQALLEQLAGKRSPTCNYQRSEKDG